LLMMPQAFAAMSLKMTMHRILARFGYRRVLTFNSLLLGIQILLFATIGAHTPVWLIVAQLFCYGFFASLQFTSLNTLVYSDVSDEETSSASTIASTIQQMSISFGIAWASIAAAIFIPDQFHSSGPQMIVGIHKAFMLLAGIVMLSATVFSRLRPTDGQAVSQHQTMEPHGEE
ncbi:MAG TPA: MFS transporter, partial [Verrucomicrobiae bacterium]|nr:MFS transporter [Verrucomicrobiae bacterium]